jgi:hypothetical protein
MKQIQLTATSKWILVKGSPYMLHCFTCDAWATWHFPLAETTCIFKLDTTDVIVQYL